MPFGCVPDHDTKGPGVTAGRETPKGARLTNSITEMPKDGWDKFEIVFKATIGLVVVPVLSLEIVQYHANKSQERQFQAQAKALEQQLQSQAEQSRSQRRMTEAQLAAGLIPLIASGREAERNMSLAALSSVAPGLAREVSSVLIERASTPAQRSFAENINTRSVQNEVELEFAKHLEYAREYRAFGLDAQACREYFAAFGAPPARLKQELVKNENAVREARKEYGSANYSTAAQLLEEVFRDSQAVRSENP